MLADSDSSVEHLPPIGGAYNGFPVARADRKHPLSPESQRVFES